MIPNDPKNANEFFDLMPVTTRNRVLGLLKDFAWRYATATAMGYQANGRRIPWNMTEELQDAIPNAALEAFFGEKGAADYKILVDKSAQKFAEES